MGLKDFFFYWPKKSSVHKKNDKVPKRSPPKNNKVPKRSPQKNNKVPKRSPPKNNKVPKTVPKNYFFAHGGREHRTPWDEREKDEGQW